jgi:hypothetical protein
MLKQKTKPRRRLCKKERYKVTNWPEYNRSLKNRGNLNVWLTSETLSNWYYSGQKIKGGQTSYSDSCIEFCVSIKILFKFGYRQTQGFIESIFTLAQIDLTVPDYSVLCKRCRKLVIKEKPTKKKKDAKGLSISADSTGLKVYGEGEWKVRIHGWSKHRTWQKLHIIVNPVDKMILSNNLTTNSIDDAAMVEPLLKQIKDRIENFSADGAYDKIKVYETLSQRNINPLIPPRKGARVKKHGNKKGKMNPRDRNIRMIRKYGRAGWKRKIKYHQRSLAETTMFRYKTIIGNKLSTRTFDRQKIETSIACKILNLMTRNGMPISRKIKC